MELQAIKGPRVYDVDESSVKDYLSRGFLIYEDGKLKYGTPEKTITQEEYDAIVAERDELQKQLESVSADTVPKEEHEKVLQSLEKAKADIKKLKEAAKA